MAYFIVFLFEAREEGSLFAAYLARVVSKCADFSRLLSFCFYCLRICFGQKLTHVPVEVDANCSIYDFSVRCDLMVDDCVSQRCHFFGSVSAIFNYFIRIV